MSKRAAQDTAASSKRFRSVIHESMDEFLCPITHSLPLDPVLAEDGKVYERKALETWLQNNNRSPSTNLPTGSKLVAATQIKNMIERMVTSDALPEEMSADWKRKIHDQKEVQRLQREAEDGSAEAAVTLGQWHSEGSHSLAQDDAKAHSFFKQAAIGGNAKAMGLLAREFFYRGTLRNMPLALRWSSAGATLGDVNSISVLSHLYSEGSAGLPRDLNEAFRLRKQAYETGSYNSMGLVKFGLMHANGTGTPIDLDKAASIMREAVAHGNPSTSAHEADRWLTINGFS